MKLQKLNLPFKSIITPPKFLKRTSLKILSRICRLKRITQIKQLIRLLKRKRKRLKKLQSHRPRKFKSNNCKNNKPLQPKIVPMLKLRSKLSFLAKNQSKSHKIILRRLYKLKQMLPKRSQKNRRKNNLRKSKNPIRLNLRFKRMLLRRLKLEKLRLLSRKIKQKHLTLLKRPKFKLRLKTRSLPIRLFSQDQQMTQNLKSHNQWCKKATR